MFELILRFPFLFFALPPDNQEITTLGEDAKVRKIPENLLVVLRVLEGPEPGKGYQITEAPLTIGRDNICSITINDPRMSRQHAVIYYYHPDFFIKDLGSTNGTFVNERMVKQTRLKNGDQIRMGGTLFEIIITKLSEDQK